MNLIEFLTKNYLCLRVVEDERLSIRKQPDRLISFYIYKNANEKLGYFIDRFSKRTNWGNKQERRTELMRFIFSEIEGLNEPY